MSSTRWVADQIFRMGAARPHAPSIPRFNPRPAGHIRPGCASEIVLAVLVARSPAFLNFAQILAQSGCTKGACDYALSYLESQGHLEHTADESRNPRYRRYRATESGQAYARDRMKARTP
jgi:hypothetical protein